MFSPGPGIPSEEQRWAVDSTKMGKMEDGGFRLLRSRRRAEEAEAKQESVEEAKQAEAEEAWPEAKRRRS